METLLFFLFLFLVRLQFAAGRNSAAEEKISASLWKTVEHKHETMDCIDACVILHIFTLVQTTHI